MCLTKKHFEKIAGILRDTLYYKTKYKRIKFDVETKNHIAKKLADCFEYENPKFDRALFLKASGVEE